MRRFSLSWYCSWVSAAALCALAPACSSPDRGPTGAIEIEPDPLGATFVHLFEWQWTDVADECEQFLGPKGFAAVQVSPPNEHIAVDTWWARYQPVSYALQSRSGNRAEFEDMVARCTAVGVDIYADIVMNHTAAWQGGGVGVAGTAWSYKSHPVNPSYNSSHYHAPCAVQDYRNANNVQQCELVGLPDLATENPEVQEQIAGYMNDLLAIGVAGFRIDAAKHMAAQDIEQILARVGNAEIFLEVIGAAGEAVQPESYTGLGRITEFAYSRDIGERFQFTALSDLREIQNNKLATANAVIFTDNHDNQRGHGAAGDPVIFTDGERYTLANVFMLAWPYGYPKVMSSYEFADTDAGPPAPGGCDSPGWVCEHRTRAIANMVAFRRVTQGQGVDHWWDNGASRIAFSRGTAGFVAINKQVDAMVETLQTGLAPGEYCDVISGNFSPEGECDGQIISVDDTGMVDARVEPLSALAIHAEAQIQ